MLVGELDDATTGFDECVLVDDLGGTTNGFDKSVLVDKLGGTTTGEEISQLDLINGSAEIVKAFSFAFFCFVMVAGELCISEYCGLK